MSPIVGIGELLWDVFPDGRKVAGGAPFNFAFHCKQLGHAAAIVSRVGDDDLGRELREEVRRLGLPDEFIQTDREHPTGTVTVSVDAAGQPTYTITEDVAWDYITCPANVRQAVPDVPAACYGTLAQRTAGSRAGILEIMEHVRGGIRVFDVNLRCPTAAEVIRSSLAHSDWVKLNADEVGAVTSLLGRGPAGLLANPGRHDPVSIVTRGPDGCEVVSRGERIRAPAPPARVVDTVGAGDAFTAAMVCLHLEGRPLRECARFANHYAARVCEYRGATPTIDRAGVERAAFG